MAISSLLLTIDVAHPPRSADEVESELMLAWSQIRNSPTYRLLKVIHGYGSHGKGGSTKEVVRNWVFRNHAKFRMVLEGERYSLMDQETREMREEIGNYHDSDLDNANPGVILIWVK